jgi:hypothetical protein
MMEPSHNDSQGLDLRVAVCRKFAGGRLPHHGKIAAGGFKVAGGGNGCRRAARRVAGPFRKHVKHVN